MKTRSTRIGVMALALGALLIQAAPVASQSLGDRVTVHGYLSQGYGSASDYPIFGIPTGGTADYRSAALQGRFMITSNDHVVLQLSHQRLGASNFMEFEDDVAVDWLFYQKRLWGNSIRAGKFPMPRGLFNEVRDVGVILPFFRASKAFYSEGVESVTGASLARSISLGSWSADLTAFTGNFDVKAEVTDQTGLIVVNQAQNNTYGGQVIINTPVLGVRAGGSYLASEYKDGGDPFSMWTASVDGAFDRFFVRGEYEEAGTTGYDYQAYYGQGGIRVYKGFWANAQAEWNTNTVAIPQLNMDLEIKAIRDYAMGISYRFSPQLVLKGEYHDFEGYQVGVPVDPFGPAVTNDYFIISMAAAF